MAEGPFFRNMKYRNGWSSTRKGTIKYKDPRAPGWKFPDWMRLWRRFFIWCVQWNPEPQEVFEFGTIWLKIGETLDLFRLFGYKRQEKEEQDQRSGFGGGGATRPFAIGEEYGSEG